MRSGRDARPSRLAKRSITIAGHRTSISLEAAFWTALRAIATQQGRSVALLVAEIDAGRDGSNLSSAIRVFVLDTVAGTAGRTSEQTGA